MNLADVMDQVAARANTIPDLRVSAWPPGTIPAPGAWIAYPEGYDYDATHGRGMDRIPDLPLIVVVGKASDRAARNQLAEYVNGAGPRSIKAVLESGTYTAFDTLRVTSVDFDILTRGGSNYLAALFTLDIAGRGA
jgi:hypothetical protein